MCSYLIKKKTKGSINKHLDASTALGQQHWHQFSPWAGRRDGSQEHHNNPSLPSSVGTSAVLRVRCHFPT